MTRHLLRSHTSIRAAGAVLATASLCAVALAMPGVANATPSQGLSAITIADTEIPAGLLPFIPAGAHVVAKQITIAPGGTTGWHFHDGPVLGIVQAGTLTHPGSDCVPVIYNTGAFINEPSGQANTHIGRNLGTDPLILDVVYLEPIGDPLFEDAPAPACDR